MAIGAPFHHAVAMCLLIGKDLTGKHTRKRGHDQLGVSGSDGEITRRSVSNVLQCNSSFRSTASFFRSGWNLLIAQWNLLP
ncbi:BZ3500_MvSof-1268-A1-R1_Chr11-1g03322 [Microbotryum saponariae]|uniref:BZ3500_MvSof-1268-A1-R1_Chr11-1g03322 protein n=1 Tax=Microbotryum saponariae TaxID=289078 RepID=A0A2X0KSE6_9BASI|nr:BZ3500_MvSof-1268-A1-R1_Chr11-2g03327 [Microbotryum saponariae]SDA03133.1 BZ3501_MvSof-1269-A2-R1_Chr11g02898 [Microbotryum saponariae]SDA03957.1 BZ3500_MvSof-1268-A1-R1_Chr11-1g03322 [Microbotryum saponariae]